MTCPYCGNPMKAGWIQSGREVYFTEKKHKFFLNHRDDEPLLTEHNLTCPTAKAYCCPACRRVVVTY